MSLVPRPLGLLLAEPGAHLGASLGHHPCSQDGGGATGAILVLDFLGLEGIGKLILLFLLCEVRRGRDIRYYHTRRCAGYMACVWEKLATMITPKQGRN